MKRRHGKEKLENLFTHSCHLCDYKSNHLRNLERHLANQHGDEELKANFCEICERVSPKCSANPITVTPIWKWKFENKERPIAQCSSMHG